jgi:hypothetical protein
MRVMDGLLFSYNVIFRWLSGTKLLSEVRFDVRLWVVSGYGCIAVVRAMFSIVVNFAPINKELCRD